MSVPADPRHSESFSDLSRQIIALEAFPVLYLLTGGRIPEGLGTRFDVLGRARYRPRRDRRDPGGFLRCRAAEALARLGDPRGGDLLAALAIAAALSAHIEAARPPDVFSDVPRSDVEAAGTDLDGRARLEVAEALARGGDSRGIDLLAALADDPALDGYVRRLAAGVRADITDGHPA